MNYQTIRVRYEDDICFLQLYRPQANNTINQLLIQECKHVVDTCNSQIKIIVLEGLPEVFCFGADFDLLANNQNQTDEHYNVPDPLYDLWHRLATGPYITIAHVRGRANAGGIGFISACDVVLADETAEFSLSELLFGLLPACVMPFLVRRIGFQKANYMTLMTKPISVCQAESWGLVDACESDSHSLLRKHLLRLRLLDKHGVKRHKNYMNVMNASLTELRESAIKMNLEVFRDPVNSRNIVRYIETGKFPWEK